MRIGSARLLESFRDWGAEVRPHQELKEWTSLGVGGTTDVILLRETRWLPQIVEGLKQEDIGWRLLGGGTNLLVRDGELPWVALHLAGRDEPPKVDGALAQIPAAADLGRTVTALAQKGLGGLEGLIGVPGSVGGALRMNAGAYGTEIGRFVERVTLYRAESNRIETLTGTEAGFGYRQSAFAPGDILLSADLRLPERGFEEIREEIKGFNQKRRRSQPVREKSAGCVFKNPPGGSAGMMIDELGLKGHRVGGAVVSEQHANFFVNRYGAVADDLFRLAEFVGERVAAEFGVGLEREVIVWDD